MKIVCPCQAFNYIINPIYCQLVLSGSKCISHRNQSRDLSIMMRTLFTLLVLALFLTVEANLGGHNRLSTKDCPPNTFWEDGCDDFDHICKISCSSGDLCEHNCGNFGSVSFDEMNINRCDKLCQDSRDSEEDAHKCRFWRWVRF